MLIAQPDSKHSGRFSVTGICRLVKDAKEIRSSKGAHFWNLFADFDYEYPKEMKESSRTLSISVSKPLSDKIGCFPKGTILFVAGLFELDEYWTKRNGKETLMLKAGFIHDLHDYASAMRSDSEAYESGTSGNDDSGSGEYDLGF